MRDLPALLDEPIGKATARQQVQGPSVEREAAAESRSLRIALDHDGVDAGEP